MTQINMFQRTGGGDKELAVQELAAANKKLAATNQKAGGEVQSCSDKKSCSWRMTVTNGCGLAATNGWWRVATKLG